MHWDIFPIASILELDLEDVLEDDVAMNEKAERNYKLRQQVSRIPPPDHLVFTRGTTVQTSEDLAPILQKIEEFEHIIQDNDPLGEHDFESFEYLGRKVYGRIAMLT